MAQDYLTLAEKYLVLHDEELGSGTFGRVLKGIDVTTNQYVAVKESRKSRHIDSMIEEGRILKELQGIVGVPEVYWHGYAGGKFYIVMQLFGENLFKKYHKNNCCNISDAAKIALQVIRVLEGIHDRGYIHVDLKIENLMAARENPRQTYLIDYGGAIKFYDETGEHLKEKISVRYVTYTRIFATPNILRSLSSSRRDDLIMLGYVLLDLLQKLPWSGKDNLDRMLVQKENLCKTRAGSVYASLPVQFYEYMVYCEELQFTQRPNYRYLESLFQTVLEVMGQNDGREKTRAVKRNREQEGEQTMKRQKREEEKVPKQEQESEGAALIQKILELTDEQVALLPDDMRATVLAMKRHRCGIVFP